MPSLDDIPTLPPCTPTGDDLIAVIDGSDRRSPKRCSLDQVVALLPTSVGGNGVLDFGLVPKFNEYGGLDCSLGFTIKDSVSSPFATATFGNSAALTATRNYDSPDADGKLALFPVIVAASPSTGFAIPASRYTDQTHYLTPAGTLAAGTFTLPTAANSRVGQIIRLWSTQAITSLTVNVSGSGTIQGTALTAGAANTPYAWQCVSTTGNGTWTRIQ